MSKMLEGGDVDGRVHGAAEKASIEEGASVQLFADQMREFEEEVMNEQAGRTRTRLRKRNATAREERQF